MLFNSYAYIFCFLPLIFIIEIENYLRHFALKQNILLLGSYDPKKYNFLSSDFFDYLHGDEIVAKRIFEGPQL